MTALSFKNFSRYLALAVVLLLFAGVVFHQTLFGGIHFCTDDNIGHISEYKMRLPAGFLSGMWQESPLVGMPATAAPINWSNLWLSLLSPRSFINLFHPLCLLAGSLAMGIYLYRKNIAPAAILLGVLAAFWLGSNFTLVYAGHIRKFAIIFLFFTTLTSIDLLFEKKRWEWSVITGCLLGLIFLEQQDVALFFGLFLGAYAVFQWVQSGQLLRHIGYLAPIPLIALLIAAFALQSAFRQNIADTAEASGTDDDAQWEYCTQWSFPPDELIAFVAPGYTGWRSGEPDGPYWGRMGRSAGWEQTRQGFMNFKLEDTYLGIIPLGLALFAFFAARRDPRRRLVYFWSAATLAALFLAFGKFTPLYRLFWQLPLIHDIRNPNKFLQIFQAGAGILTAFGADLLFTRLREEKTPILSRFFWALSAVTILLLLMSIGRGGAAALLNAGWPQQAVDVIVRNKSHALLHAALLSGLLTFFAAVYCLKTLAKLRPYRAVWITLLVAAVLLDAKLLSRHYVQTLPESYIADNAVTDYLRDHLGDQRVAMVTQDGFYNLWLTYLFPYHQILSFNFAQMPRMPEDYKQILQALGRTPIRLWQLSAAGFLLAPSSIESQLPPGQYLPCLRFDVTPSYDGRLSVSVHSKGSHTLFQSRAASPRFALIGGAERLSNAEALNRLTSNDWKPFEKLILSEKTDAPLLNGSGICGTVEVMEHRPERSRLRVHADAAGYLRAADKYDPDWIATVDGAPTPVLRADFICQAVSVPAGDHVVELIYSPSNRSVALQLTAYAVTALAVLSLLFRRRRPTAE